MGDTSDTLRPDDDDTLRHIPSWYLSSISRVPIGQSAYDWGQTQWVIPPRDVAQRAKRGQQACINNCLQTYQMSFVRCRFMCRR